MRCPDCNKFVSYDDSQEPEVSLDVQGESIVGDVRIVLPCADCGTDLKEYTFDIDEGFEFPDSKDGQHDEHDVTINANEATLEVRTEGAGRGLRTFYGFELSVSIECSCGAKAEKTLKDDVQASSMDEVC